MTFITIHWLGASANQYNCRAVSLVGFVRNNIKGIPYIYDVRQAALAIQKVVWAHEPIVLTLLYCTQKACMLQ